MNSQTSKTRLQAERLKRQWTQAETAEKVKVDTKIFALWERGSHVARPSHRRALSEVFGEEVDRSWFILSEDVQEAPDELWYVPYGRNPYFIDTAQQIEQLHILLTSGGKEKSHAAISGLGGIVRHEVV